MLLLNKELRETACESGPVGSASRYWSQVPEEMAKVKDTEDDTGRTTAGSVSPETPTISTPFEQDRHPGT